MPLTTSRLVLKFLTFDLSFDITSYTAFGCRCSPTQSFLSGQDSYRSEEKDASHQPSSMDDEFDFGEISFEGKMVLPPAGFFDGFLEQVGYDSSEEGVRLPADYKDADGFNTIIGTEVPRSDKVKFLKYRMDCFSFGALSHLLHSPFHFTLLSRVS